MATDLTRRGVLAGMTAGLASTVGCVEYLLTGCESQNKYSLILTEVDREVLRTDPIPYRSLSENERRLVQEAMETGRFEVCHDAGSEEQQAAFFELRDRVREHGENGYAYLRYDGRYFQIGLVLSAVLHARTRHHPDETSTPVNTTGDRTPRAPERGVRSLRTGARAAQPAVSDLRGERVRYRSGS